MFPCFSLSLFFPFLASSFAYPCCSAPFPPTSPVHLVLHHQAPLPCSMQLVNLTNTTQCKMCPHFTLILYDIRRIGKGSRIARIWFGYRTTKRMPDRPKARDQCRRNSAIRVAVPQGHALTLDLLSFSLPLYLDYSGSTRSGRQNKTDSL